MILSGILQNMKKNYWKQVKRLKEISLYYASKRKELEDVKYRLSKKGSTEGFKRFIKNLLLTNSGDRPFHPEIGSGIYELLFENYGPITANRLQRAIEELLGNYEPRARITEVDCQPQPNTNSYNIVIHFYVENVEAELQEFQTILEAVR